MVVEFVGCRFVRARCSPVHTDCVMSEIPERGFTSVQTSNALDLKRNVCTTFLTVDRPFSKFPTIYNGDVRVCHSDVVSLLIDANKICAQFARIATTRSAATASLRRGNICRFLARFAIRRPDTTQRVSQFIFVRITRRMFIVL